ncbi:hypothetical protein ABIB82_006102 [Bradyrhizobium sp. i1.8.4]
MAGLKILHRATFDRMDLHALLKPLRVETNELHGWIGWKGLAVFGTDGEPDHRRNAIGQVMEGERRGQRDDPFGHALGGFGEGMVRIDGRVGQLVETAPELDNEAFFLHAGDSRGRDPCRGNLGRARCRAP